MILGGNRKEKEEMGRKGRGERNIQNNINYLRHELNYSSV